MDCGESAGGEKDRCFEISADLSAIIDTGAGDTDKLATLSNSDVPISSSIHQNRLTWLPFGMTVYEFCIWMFLKRMGIAVSSLKMASACLCYWAMPSRPAERHFIFEAGDMQIDKQWLN